MDFGNYRCPFWRRTEFDGYLADYLPVSDQYQSQNVFRLTLGQVRNNNLIYIGEFKNLRVLDKMIAKLPFAINIIPMKDYLF
jgi:hypothetical protein